MTVPVYHAVGGSLVRKGRATIAPTPGPGPLPGGTVTRPTGPGYYAIEDLAVGMDFTAAMAKVKTLAAGTRPSDGTSHRTLTLPGTTSSPFVIGANGFAAGVAAGFGFLFEESVSVFGSGEGATIFQVTPDSITQAQVDAKVPAIDSYPNNIGLRIAVVPNGVNVRLENFGMRGTQQRVGGTGTQGAQWDTYHYTGLSLTRHTNLTVENVKVWSIPGYRNSPPGETTAVSVLGGSAYRFVNVEIDGRRSWGDGSKISGAGFGTSSTTNVRYERCYAHHMGFSHGFAFWQTNGITAVDCVSTDNGGGQSASLGGTAGDGFNFERSRNSLLVRPTVGRNTLCELRYYGRNDGDSYDGDTFPHRVENLTLLEGNLDIRIDKVQRTDPVLVSCPPPVFHRNPG